MNRLQVIALCIIATIFGLLIIRMNGLNLNRKLQEEQRNLLYQQLEEGHQANAQAITNLNHQIEGLAHTRDSLLHSINKHIKTSNQTSLHYDTIRTTLLSLPLADKTRALADSLNRYSQRPRFNYNLNALAN